MLKDERVLCESKDGLEPDEDFWRLGFLPPGKLYWPSAAPAHHRIKALTVRRDGRFMLVFSTSWNDGYVWSKYETGSMEVAPEVVEALKSWFADAQKAADIVRVLKDAELDDASVARKSEEVLKENCLTDTLVAIRRDSCLRAHGLEQENIERMQQRAIRMAGLDLDSIKEKVEAHLKKMGLA